ncbi:MAG: hypothetical protein Q4G43_08390 [Mobilicoccus sp.]|nr:hypothetical protein [Mobilicoccus sp.]
MNYPVSKPGPARTTDTSSPYPALKDRSIELPEGPGFDPNAWRYFAYDAGIPPRLDAVVSELLEAKRLARSSFSGIDWTDSARDDLARSLADADRDLDAVIDAVREHCADLRALEKP